MPEFLKKTVGKFDATNAVNLLANTLLMQYFNKNITIEEINKIIEIAKNKDKLKNVLKFL